MPSYNLNGLGPHEFERLAQALVMAVIGSGAAIFGPGRDGAREATFSGKAPYPSEAEQWDGRWIFQAKFHDTQLTGVDKARKRLITDVTDELRAIKKYGHGCDNYIIITNVPLSAVPVSGTRAKLEDAFVRASTEIKNFAVWSADEVSRLLEKYPDIRTSYLQYITTGDLIAKLLRREDEDADDLGRTMMSYIRTTYAREQNAQLDQAGDVSDEPVRLQHVFFDLTGIARIEGRPFSRIDSLPQLFTLKHGEANCPVVKLLLSEEVSRVVLIGGPGEGKSTAGQYLAQLHRATLLNAAKEIAIDESYLPAIPRIPLRIILRDFGQWLSSRIEDDPTSGTLEEYVCAAIEALTGRTLLPEQFHRVVTSNPTLLILDGLDEVMDAVLKKSLMERLGEFVERCEEVYKADMQVLATTRPTRYMEQFDPKHYLYLRLARLQPSQVKTYVQRWTKAKELDEAKTSRVLEGIGECLADPQIRLLATTPLQVTILAVIVTLGGTPPRQREALFNEYLEVIYKRETAKGRHIIQSEKEELLGLHKYVGYMLHQKATAASAVSAAFDRAEYEKIVTTFLQFQNPYSPEPVVRSKHKAITQDAGDRLVLIVEPTPDRFGFELRSIQEFFAACHLLDTSNSTEQRYLRFEAISRSSHWRNVALFFAGRTGRNYQGEVSNLVEVCRATDRDGIDRHLRRGSELALELAVDRAFGPYARGQRSLLEHGLLILESDLSRNRRDEICDLLQKLPADDVRDHVSFLLRERFSLLDSRRLEHLCHAACAVQDEVLTREILAKMAAYPSTKPSCLRALLDLGCHFLPTSTSIADLIESSGPDAAWQMLSQAPWSRVYEALRDVEPADFGRTVLRDLLAKVISLHPDLGSYRESNGGVEAYLAPGWGAQTMWPLHAAAIVVAMRGKLIHGRRRRLYQEQASVLQMMAASANVPSFVLDGAFEGILPEELSSFAFVLPMWLVHLWVGNTSVDSLEMFCEVYSSSCRQPAIRAALRNYRNLAPNPVVEVLASNVEAGKGQFRKLCGEIVEYSGIRGSLRWANLHAEVSQAVEEKGWRGGIKRRSNLVRKLLDDSIPASLLDYALQDMLPMRPHPDEMERAVSQFLHDEVVTTQLLSQSEFVTSYMRGSGRFSPDLRAVIELVLKTSRPDGPELLSIFLPIVLSSEHQIADELAVRALSVVGSLINEDSGILHAGPTRLTPGAFEWLMNIACSVPREAAGRGALYLLRNFCTSFHVSDRHGSQPSRPRYRGFAEAHRSLIRSDDPLSREVGLTLFILRPPSSQDDFRLLSSCVQVAWTRSLHLVLAAAIHTASRSDHGLARWSAELSNWLELDLCPEARAVLLDHLDRLLSADEQSLESLHGDLGLPLQH